MSHEKLPEPILGTARNSQPRWSSQADAGFSLVELLVASMILITVMLVPLALWVQAHKIFERVQSSSSSLTTGYISLRQMAREIKMAGFPPEDSFSANAVVSFPGIVADSYVAASDFDLAFEADVDGDGAVERIEYVLPAGSETILRFVTRKNADGTLAPTREVSEVLSNKVLNQLRSEPLFRWEIDGTSSTPFPRNIRTVYINLILRCGPMPGGASSELRLTATCPRIKS